jgi:predicted GIY-YIG superfamily endonuclease
MYYVYILKNNVTEKYYTGFSQNLKSRLKNHKQKTVKTTKGDGNYTLIWYCAFVEKTKALDFEKYLKHGSGYAFARKRLT